MIIICGHETICAGRRDTVVEQFMPMVARARQFDGCFHFALSPDLNDPDRINTVEVWRDEQALEEWRAQADPPDVGDVFESMDLKRYNATDGGPLFAE